MTTIIIAAILLILLAATMVLLQREKRNSSLAWQAVRALEDQLERTKSVSSAAFEEAKDAIKAAIDIADEVRKLRKRVDELGDGVAKAKDAIKAAIDIAAEARKLRKRVGELENGVVPGFEEAKAAVKAVNDFNVGLSAIMGYDPMQAIRKGRDAEGESE